MNKKICFLILFQICLWLSTVSAQGTTVVMDEQVKVNGSFIELGQIARISGDDEETNQRLRQMKIGDAPVPGGSFVLTRDIIMMRLAAAGADMAGITWVIPGAVTVAGNSQVISSQTLIDKAIETIRKQVGPGVNYDDLNINFAGRMQDVTAPVGDVALSASLPYGIRYNTPVTVSIAVSVNGQSVAKVGLKFNVKLYRQVAVAAAGINARDVFTQESLRYERMDMGQIPPGFFTDKNKIIGLMARRTITPGMVITDSMVNKPVLVKRGDAVILVALLGNMEVTAAGQSMQDGYEGQLIRIKNVSSNKIILGKVIAANKVQVLTYKSTLPSS